MKAVITRLRRLEERLVPQVDLASARVATCFGNDGSAV